MSEKPSAQGQKIIHLLLVLVIVGVLVASAFQLGQLVEELTAWGMDGRAVAAQAPASTPTKPPTPTETRASQPRQPKTFVFFVTATPTVATTATPMPPTPTPVPTRPTPPPDIVEIARSHGIDTGGRYIVVDQAEQRMFIVDGNVLVRILPVSTGDPERRLFTPPWVGRVGVYWGTFSAHGVSADNAWHLFKAPGGNILIHGLPYTTDASGRKIYQDMDKLGNTPASRGCIRLRPDDARWFTEWGPAGVPIVILPHPRQER